MRRFSYAAGISIALIFAATTYGVELGPIEGERQAVASPSTFNEPTPGVPTMAFQDPLTELQSSSTLDARRSLLKQKLQERDLLQREIAELRAATQMPEQIHVRVKVLEVNRTKLRQSGVGVEVIDVNLSRPIDLTKYLSGEERHGKSSGAANPRTKYLSLNYLTLDSPALAGALDRLEQEDFVRTIAEPSVVVLDGRQVLLKVGGEFPVPPANQGGAATSKDYGTQLELTANSLGNNQVCLEIHPRVTELDESRGIVVDGKSVPALTVREVDFSGNVEFGRSIVVGGLEQERRIKKSTWGYRQRDEVEQIALVVVATPELVR